MVAEATARAGRDMVATVTLAACRAADAMRAGRITVDEASRIAARFDALVASVTTTPGRRRDTRRGVVVALPKRGA